MINVMSYNYLNTNGGDVRASRQTIETLGGVLMKKIITCGIYKITNLINGMCYIGQSKRIETRFKEHKSGERQQHNYYLHNAIDKYGIENFSFETLIECSIDQLDNFERDYILNFNSLKPNGYNLESGGNVNKEISIETKEKMSLSKRGEKHNFFGTIRSFVTKQRISIGNSVSVNQYSLNGEYIKTFSSMNDAISEIGTTSSSHISRCCNEIRKQAGGYQWRYASLGRENITAMKDKPPLSDFHKTILSLLHEVPVLQFTRNGEYVAKYNSAKKAGEATGINWKVISACRTGKKKSAGGFVWKYEEPEL